MNFYMLLKLYKYCFTILFVLTFCNCKEESKHYYPLNIYAGGNYIPDISCELLVQQIRTHNRYEGQNLGIGGTPSEQYNRFKMLCNKASDEDLLQLVNDTNAVMRCYAFLGLSQRNMMCMESVLKEHLNDTTSVNTQFGCIGMSEEVNCIFLSIASSYLGEAAINKYRSVATYKKVDVFSAMH